MPCLHATRGRIHEATRASSSYDTTPVRSRFELCFALLVVVAVLLVVVILVCCNNVVDVDVILLMISHYSSTYGSTADGILSILADPLRSSHNNPRSEAVLDSCTEFVGWAGRGPGPRLRSLL